MTDDHSSHLDEGQVLLALVDETDLPDEVRAHLGACPSCQAACRGHADQLQRLTELARAGTPLPSRRVNLPRESRAGEGRRPHLGWSWPWGPATALAALALVVLVLGTFWWRSGQDERLAGLNRETRQDQVLIAEVKQLETDGLPSLYTAIAGDDDVDDDDDPWDLMVPRTEDEARPGQKSSETHRGSVKSSMLRSRLDGSAETWFRVV